MTTATNLSATIVATGTGFVMGAEIAIETESAETAAETEAEAPPDLRTMS